jgi:alkanesulfonate monooxygenase SsuD/methylene tetrahydromethanopterin reductase-like flavin-dependent oxidoreductase (luciferase family)
VTSPQIAISIPQLVPDGAFDPAALRRYLSRAEELGFDGAWTTEQVIGTAPNLDSSAVLGYAAACTEQIRLGCAVYVSTVASPLHLAKIIASLDQLSRGRLEVGLGTGGRFRPFAAFGIDGEGFVSRFTEGVRYMQEAWTQDRINFEGHSGRRRALRWNRSHTRTASAAVVRWWPPRKVRGSRSGSGPAAHPPPRSHTEECDQYRPNDSPYSRRETHQPDNAAANVPADSPGTS